jgi:hypothetical protein
MSDDKVEYDDGTVEPDYDDSAIESYYRNDRILIVSTDTGSADRPDRDGNALAIPDDVLGKATDTSLFDNHVARLRSSLQAHSKETICAFIQTHTYLRGRPFSFEDHEYQKYIIEDQSPEKIVIKSAQMGISEMSTRIAIAMGNLIDGFNTIYTLPSAKAAQSFMKTRIDPIISSSPYLKNAVSSAVDNTEVKQFGESYLYLKGAQIDTQAISVPADMLIGDEVDNSNPDVLTLFESRLIHSRYQWKIKLSTPSIPKFGIDLLYSLSRKHVHLCKCHHCNHWFEPDYFKHVRIPEFKGEIDEITKGTFANPSFRWQEAYVACPKCGDKADLREQHRNWVCENPTDNYIAAGFKVSPFSCPNIILPSHIVKSSVEYKRKQDFYNQRLGIALEDKESTLTADELYACLIKGEMSSGHPRVMGLDMGAECYCTIADVLPDGQLIIIHKERIPLFKVVARRKELAVKFRVRMSVVDHGPYTETVYRMQQGDPRVFAAVYVRNWKSADIYKVKDVEKDKDEGIDGLKQVNISRDKAFDFLMLEVRDNNIKMLAEEGTDPGEVSREDEMWINHLQDMKRVREFQADELVFVWTKVSGEDHYHHSLLYCMIASKMFRVGGNTSVLKSLVTKFHVKNK